MEQRGNCSPTHRLPLILSATSKDAKGGRDGTYGACRACDCGGGVNSGLWGEKKVYGLNWFELV
jgi:hypothetical protein